MENFVRNSKLNIEEEIKRIELQTVDPLDRIRQIIGVVQKSIGGNALCRAEEK